MQDTNFCSRSFFSWTFSYTDGKNTKYIKHVTETKKSLLDLGGIIWDLQEKQKLLYIITDIYNENQHESAHSKWKGTFCNWLFKASLSCNKWQWQNFHEICKLPSKTLMRSSLMFFANSKSWRHMKYLFWKKKIHASIRSLVKFWCWASKLSFSLDIQKNLNASEIWNSIPIDKKQPSTCRYLQAPWMAINTWEKVFVFYTKSMSKSTPWHTLHSM